jgi:P-type conjugative transfer protein TrbJ
MAKITNLTVTLYLVFIVSFNAHAGSVAGFGGATEITQILNNVQLMSSYVQEVSQVANQITQISNQLQMYQNMITNTQSLVGQPLQNAMQTLNQLRNAINQASQLSYTFQSVDQYFQQLNPNYANLFQGNNYANQQQFWRTSVDTYCEASLKTASFEIADMQNETQFLASLNQRSSSALGQKEAIQAGNEIALHMVAQMDRLKSLTATQAQTQSAYFSVDRAQKEAEEMSVRDLYQYDPNVTNPNDNQGF